MGGSPDQSKRAENGSGGLNWQIGSAQVRSIGFDGCRHVHSIIHDEQGSLNNPAQVERQPMESAVGEALGPELDNVGAAFYELATNGDRVSTADARIENCIQAGPV
jgi:hypothetical protein